MEADIAMGVGMLKVRIANESDSKDIFEWRNHETTRNMSHSTDLVDWQKHSRWLESALGDKNRCLLVCTTLDGVDKVAVVRFDISDNVATISVNLSPSMRGRGLAKNCLKDSIVYLKSVRSMVSVIDAEIKSMNVASRKAFEGAGFSLFREIDDVCYYKLQLSKLDLT